MAQLALANSFLKSYDKLPKSQKKSVRALIDQFRHNPRHPSINFEKLNFADDKIRSARIDQAYRAIIVSPPQGDVHLIAWVDHHDEAYRWAKNKRFDVNAHTGTLQVYSLIDAGEAPSESEARPAWQTAWADSATTEDVVPDGRLFTGQLHSDLLFLGVPEPLLPSVRAMRHESELYDMAAYLPEDAFDALHMLSEGFSLERIVDEIGGRPDEEIDTTNFEAALQRPASQAAFALPADESELAGILEAPLEQWRCFLHPSQRELVEWNVDGPIRVLGGAGTGKTVVLMHRAKHLAKHVFNAPTDRILVTTYTVNLAKDLAAHLRGMRADDEEQDKQRLQVSNLHNWCAEYLKREHVEVTLANASQRDRLRQQALAETEGELHFPASFYWEEWAQIVLAHGIRERKAYLTVRRVGRGTRLSTKQRLHVWKVMSAYRALLDAEGLMEHPDLVRETRLLLERTNTPPPFAAVLADEVQDFSAEDLRLLRALARPGRNDMFLVGDAHQRIYGRRTALSRCGIEIRGRSKRLRVNYRTTELIRAWAVALVEGRDIDDLDGGTDTLEGYRSLREGLPPAIHRFDSPDAEATFIVEQLRAWLDAGAAPHEIVLAARTNRLASEHYAGVLERAGLLAVTIRRTSSDALGEGIRLATMHRLKGLEFPYVLLAGIDHGTVPQLLGDEAERDAVSLGERELSERSLLYVAATRARDELVITSSGAGSPFLG